MENAAENSGTNGKNFFAICTNSVPTEHFYVLEYLVDIRSEASLNPFWEYINGK
jgi:hypothetical protein